MGKNTDQAEEWLQKCYPGSAPSIATIKRWFADFKRGRTDTDDAERSGRPNEAVIPENITKINKMIMADRKLKLQKIADILKISKGSVYTILHDHLGMRKLCSKWVPRLLTPEQKQNRVDDSESCLTIFKRNPNEFLRRYVTMDETWVHHFTPESNRQSAEWTEAGGSRPKRPKTQKSAGKGKRYGSNEEVIAETEAYFEAKDKSFYKTGIEKLERRWNDCITLKGDYVDE
ncbi:histone-lysine N-methyltransferase SETMAR-like [Sitodiplosis mosellana]|uniref:histone-lysine N-methyltransferase SETMAR-like n=1 Tax=Sitodiplosis mosellana TaxID=263140 RepID=UPI0024442C92|nr:histone-lysine N-methyltransferase SETMAR-like [Sitodiplosis mosellana]